MASSDINKATQKVKESLSRMNKNGLIFSIVNLEAMSSSNLYDVGIATLKMKAGKDSYMCTGKIICLVSYEENDIVNTETTENTETTDITATTSVTDITTTKNRINILINISQELYSSIHAGYVGCSLEGKKNVTHDPFGTDHPELLNGLFNYLSNDAKCGDIHGQTPKDENDNTNYIYMNSYYDMTPFKSIDDVIKRFYDLMRQRGLLIDEEDDDLGAMAEASGIEW